MELDFENDIQIDPDALDVEWLEQPNLARKYIKYAAQMRREERLADERVKTIRSELVNEANVNPEGTTGKSKPNAQDIEAYYRSHKDYRAAKAEWIEAAYEADFAELAKDEICYGRKKALENLVVLYGQSYFAGPKVPRNLSEEASQRKMDSKVRIRQQRRTT